MDQYTKEVFSPDGTTLNIIVKKPTQDQALAIVKKLWLLVDPNQKFTSKDIIDIEKHKEFFEVCEVPDLAFIQRLFATHPALEAQIYQEMVNIWGGNCKLEIIKQDLQSVTLGITLFDTLEKENEEGEIPSETKEVTFHRFSSNAFFLIEKSPAEERAIRIYRQTLLHIAPECKEIAEKLVEEYPFVLFDVGNELRRLAYARTTATKKK